MTRRARGERGGVTVLVALMAVSALLMAALVLDLGELRADRRTNKGVTDMAARAGIGRLAFGPWSGVCKARDFLLANAKGFSSFDAGSETWSRASGTVIGANPCPAVVSAADTVACAPNNPATWAKLQATAGQGRFTIEIQAGYTLPDPRFPIDADLGDTGVPELGGCDNLAVILTERQAASFAQVSGGQETNVRVRSVGRLNAAETLDFVAALQLLDRHNCDVLTTGGSGTKVIAQAYNSYPGTIQIDSDGAAGGDCTSNKRILVGGETTNGGTIVACSANETRFGCVPGTGDRTSRIGIYAINFKLAESVTSKYSATGTTSYGDTKAIASPRTGRKYVDLRYREKIAALDQEVKAMLAGSSPYPPGCAANTVVDGMCTGNGNTPWLVVSDCSSTALTLLNLDLVKRASQNVWFRCSLNVAVPLTLSGSNAYIVVTGMLTVNSIFTLDDPRKVYVGGTDAGNKIGLELTGSGTLNMNTGGAIACSGRAGTDIANRLVVGKGSLRVGAGFTVRLCHTFTYLASGYDKVPAADGTVPCLTTACGNYSGTISISSGANVDMSAPNQITGRLPSAAELANTNPFEDLVMWTEAGGNSNTMAGGASTNLTGVFFLPNAKDFNLTGGGSLPIRLSAQFVSTTLKVTGNATINLVPNPEDSIPVTIYTTLLVR